MNARGDYYKVVSPTATGMVHVDLCQPSRAVLSKIQHNMQLTHDRKVSMREIFSGLLLGKIRPADYTR